MEFVEICCWRYGLGGLDDGLSTGLYLGQCDSWLGFDF